MWNKRSWILVFLLMTAVVVQSQPLGIFTEQISVGDDNLWGSAKFSDGVYEVLGSGNDIWGSGQSDGFYYVYKPVTGDFVATCDAVWGKAEEPLDREPTEGDFWKKMGWMARNAVNDPEDRGAAHASALIIRDLQSNFCNRPVGQGETFDTFYEETEDLSDKTSKIRLTREGNVFKMYRGQTDGGFLQRSSIEIEEAEPTLMVGLVVTSHDTTALERAFFSNVEITQGGSAVDQWSVY